MSSLDAIAHELWKFTLLSRKFVVTKIRGDEMLQQQAAKQFVPLNDYLLSNIFI